MAGNQYRVIITHEKNVIAGLLEISEQGKPRVFIDFDPTTILCDLFDTVDYEKRSDNESENYFFSSGWFKHPFSAIQLPHDVFESYFHSQVQFSWYYNFIVELKELCEKSRNISLSQFKVFRQYFDTRFTYKIEFQEDNPRYNEYEYSEADNAPIIDDREYIYRSIEENNNFTMQEILDIHADTPSRHNYSCYSLADIICSVWHYLILHDYKFSCCNHCGEYFATQTLKKLYCDRRSPYPGFEQHNCEQAVRNIKQKLARRKKSAYTYLSDYYGGGVNLFLDEYARLKDAVDTCSSVENLKALEVFSSKENVRKEWYKPEYK